MCLIGKPLTGLMTLVLLSVYLIAPSAAAQRAAIEWDTIYTHDGMYTGNPPGVECVGLIVSNHGEMGHAGLGRVNMDYAESGLECGSRPEDAIYLYSGSPFVILADDASGTNASLTCSYGEIDGTKPCAWVPTGEPGSVTGGFGDACPIRLPQFSAKMISKEGAISLERAFFVPLNDDADISFIVAVTKVYSHDGLSHPHITVGSVTDWSIPSDSVNTNTSLATSGLVALQGTDTSLSQACQPNTNRYSCEAFGGWARSSDLLSNYCANNSYYWGCMAANQRRLRDTNLARDGSTIIEPPQPDAGAWWEDIAASPGLNPDPNPSDQALWLTYVYDYNLVSTDTLWFWSIMATTRDYPSQTELVQKTSYAKDWFTSYVRRCHGPCCICRRGDVNSSGETPPDEVTLGDIMLLVDVKFISGDCSKLVCIETADVNGDGGSSPTCEEHVTLGDIMTLVDHLFISNAPLPFCP